MPQVDVAIVGGGPGGSSAGAFLARRGIGVALFEREALYWIRMPWRVRRSLRLLFGIARVETWMRRGRGLPVESRLEW